MLLRLWRSAIAGALLLGETAGLAAAAPVAAGSPLAVTRWGWTGPHGAVGGPGQRATFDEAAGGPIYLWFDLDGGANALDLIRNDGAVTIDVHWVRESGPSPAAPNLVTRLSIGDGALLDRLEGEIHRRGAFTWHSWARKDTLSPGVWSVFLTYPDGRPLACEGGGAPCRLTIDIG